MIIGPDRKSRTESRAADYWRRRQASLRRPTSSIPAWMAVGLYLAIVFLAFLGGIAIGMVIR